MSVIGLHDNVMTMTAWLGGRGVCVIKEGWQVDDFSAAASVTQSSKYLLDQINQRITLLPWWVTKPVPTFKKTEPKNHPKAEVNFHSIVEHPFF